MRKNTAPVIAAAVYTAAYALVYAGWLCHSSLSPRALGYSRGYLAFLAAMTGPFLLPAAVAALARRAGWQRLILALTATGLLGGCLYAVAALTYYRGQEHGFDPFLQAPPPPLAGLREPKGADEFRILCLGGSTTKSTGVREEARYPALLQRMLGARIPGMRFRVFNAGQDWYTTKHSLINFTTLYADWKPDLVIIMHAINDLCRSFSPPSVAMGPYAATWSHFYGPSIRGARPATYEAYLLERLQPLRDAWYSDFRFRERDYSPEEFLSLPDFGDYYDKLIRQCRQTGARVIVVTQPFLYREDNTPRERQALVFPRYLASRPRPRAGLSYPSPGSMAGAMRAYNAAAAGLAARHGVLLCDAAAAVPRDLEHFVDDVHHTERTTALIAGMLADAIVSAGLPDRR